MESNKSTQKQNYALLFLLFTLVICEGINLYKELKQESYEQKVTRAVIAAMVEIAKENPQTFCLQKAQNKEEKAK